MPRLDLSLCYILAAVVGVEATIILLLLWKLPKWIAQKLRERQTDKGGT